MKHNIPQPKKKTSQPTTPDWKVRRWRKVMLLRGSLGSLDHQSRYLLALSSKDMVPAQENSKKNQDPKGTIYHMVGHILWRSSKRALKNRPFPLVNIQTAIEHGHRNSWFIKTWWFSRVFCKRLPEGTKMVATSNRFLKGPPPVMLAVRKSPINGASNGKFLSVESVPRLITRHTNNWLVVGPPLWKIWVRQLGWWHSQVIWEHKKWQPNHQPDNLNCSPKEPPCQKPTFLSPSYHLPPTQRSSALLATSKG